MDETNKKSLLLRLPDYIFSIMKRYKKLSGVSYTNQLYNAMVWWLVTKNLLDLSEVKNNHKEEKPKKIETENFQSAPQEILYCDSDKCEIPSAPFIQKSC